LDGLRGIAASWVVIYHFIYRIDAYWLPDNPALAAEIIPWHVNLWGLLAVHLFFIISGFVIFMTIERSNTVLDFAVSRVARLYPAFWVSVLLTTLLAVALPVPIQQVTLGQAAVNLTMLNLFVAVPSVELVYWSLAYELAFYVLMAILLTSGLIRKIEIVGSIWVGFAFVLLKLVPALGDHIPWRIQTALILPYASLFFAGIIFFKIWTEGATKGRYTLVILCLLEHVWGHSAYWTAIMTVVFAVFALCVSGRGRWLASRPCIFLGTISYSLYLIHGTLGFRLQLLNHALGLPPLANLVVALAVTVSAAAAVTYLVERPANRAIRAFYRRATSARRFAEPRAV
jgi:peptidoglycan/LPS O-acetylase OafA/YrhL